MHRSLEDALTIAHSFFAQHTATRSFNDIHLVAVSGDLLESTSTRNPSHETSFYIFNQGQSAYVIVSGDDRMKPILGYSDRGTFVTDNLPTTIQEWLGCYEAVYAALVAGEHTTQEPRLLTRTAFPRTVTPLLGDINWNQDTPYNNTCPLVRRERSMTGCVATAMAMILKYHGYPAKGKGTHSYQTPSGTEYSFDFENTTFQWDKMLPQYVNGNYTNEQAKAVADLMYACGVAVDMEYSPSSSGAYSHSVGQGLIDYFGYDENMEYIHRQYFTSEEWMNMIKKELSEGRPIYYNGASKEVGHAFVFDGYDVQNMVHVNWGWGGLNNGYFEVASLNPSAPGIGGGTCLGGGFVNQQGMYIGMQPPTASSSYTSHFYLSALTVSKENVAKKEKFDLTATDLFNMSTTFQKGLLGLIAEKDGKQSEIWSSSLGVVKINYGMFELSLPNIAIPQELTDGTYALYLATKEQRETKWSRVRGGYGYESQLTLTVAGDNCTMLPFAGTLNIEKDLTGSVTPVHGLYSGYKGDFKVLLSNKSSTSEFYGLSGVLFVTADKEQDIVGFIGANQLELEPGTSNREFIISGKLVNNLTEDAPNIPAGDYHICAGAVWGEYVYGIGEELIPVTIKKASLGFPALVVGKARLEKKSIEVGEKLKLLAELSLSGSGDVYNKTLMAAIFARNQSSTSNLHYAEVFIEKGIPLALEMSIDPQLDEGVYIINLYEPELLGGYNGNNPLLTLDFFVTPVTGIEDEMAEKDGLIICQQPVEDILYIRTNSSPKTIAIYNLAGQQMLMLQGSIDNACKEYAIPIESLTPDYYIVLLQATNGKTYHAKFMKR